MSKKKKINSIMLIQWKVIKIMWLTLKKQANCAPTQNLEDQQLIYKARTNVV
jgi:hypothetical protein